MISKKRLLRKSRLYLILDKKTAGRRTLTAVANKLKKTGLDLIQLRDKTSDKLEVLKEAFLLKKALLGFKTLLIINDYADIAAICGADGVHLGQCDERVKKARSILGRKRIIGVSCHSLKQALAAQKNGADYVGFGPVYSSPTKPEYKPVGLKELIKLKARIKIPYFAIGDINKTNLSAVLGSGAKRVALCRGILKTKNPVYEVRTFKALLK